MAVKPIVMPQLGESVAEATLVHWHIKEGDLVERDQTIAEASTDKADTELPAPMSGRVVRILVKEGETVPVLTPIAEFETEVEARAATGPARAATEAATARPAAKASPELGAAAARSPAPAVSAAPPTPITRAPPEAAPKSAPTPRRPEAPRPEAAARLSGARAAPRERARTSPLVRRMAREKHVDVGEIPGTGANGRVTKDDLLRYLARGEAESRAPAAPAREERRPVAVPAPAPPPAEPLAAAPAAPAAPAGLYKPPEYRPLPGDEVISFSRRRRLIAEHMVYSKQTAPHVPCMAEIDLHRVTRARAKAKAEGQTTSVLAYFAAATVRAAREYPTVNATVLRDAYVLRKVVNLGVAVDTPDGLVVPVIRDADSLSLVGMTRAIADCAEKARTGRLTADELSGGTITLSNPGTKGNSWGAAIINQPQVAILRMGEIIKRPVVIAVEDEDAIVIRPILNLTLSYDHRIIDGVVANGFLHRIKELLEQTPEAL